MVNVNLSILDARAGAMGQTDRRNTVSGGGVGGGCRQMKAGEWERLHTLHSGGCGFEGALLPV